MNNQNNAAVRWGTFLFFCLLLVFGAYILRMYQPHTFAWYDPGWQVEVVRSLIEDRDLDLKNQLREDENTAADQTSLGLNGEWYPVHEYFIAILTLPFYYLLGINGCLLFNLLLSVALMMGVYFICLRHVPAIIAFLSTSLTAFTTLFLDYSYSYSIDVFAACLLLWAILLIITNYPFLSGLIWGMSVFGRLTNMFSAPAFLFYLLFKKNPLKSSTTTRNSNFLLFALGSFPGLIFVLLSNYYMYGHPLKSSYQNWVRHEAGQTKIIDQSQAFNRPLIKGLVDTLLDPKHGLIAGAPLILIALIFGTFGLWKSQRSDSIFIALLSGILIIVHAKFAIGNPGSNGNRYLMIVVCLMAVPLCYALQKINFEKEIIKDDK